MGERIVGRVERRGRGEGLELLCNGWAMEELHERVDVARVDRPETDHDLAGRVFQRPLFVVVWVAEDEARGGHGYRRLCGLDGLGALTLLILLVAFFRGLIERLLDTLNLDTQILPKLTTQIPRRRIRRRRRRRILPLRTHGLRRRRGASRSGKLLKVQRPQLLRIGLAHDGLEATDAIQQLMLPGPRGAPGGLAGRVDAVDAEARALGAVGLDLVAFDFALATA